MTPQQIAPLIHTLDAHHVTIHLTPTGNVRLAGRTSHLPPHVLNTIRTNKTDIATWLHNQTCPCGNLIKAFGHNGTSYCVDCIPSPDWDTTRTGPCHRCGTPTIRPWNTPPDDPLHCSHDCTPHTVEQAS